MMLLAKDEATREDAAFVGLVEEWQSLRARLRLYYADSSTCTTEDYTRMVDEMESLEGRIARFRPASFLGVREVLSMASDILAEQIRRPDMLLGDGPALELVCRASHALAECEGSILGCCD